MVGGSAGRLPWCGMRPGGAASIAQRCSRPLASILCVLAAGNFLPRVSAAIAPTAASATPTLRRPCIRAWAAAGASLRGRPWLFTGPTPGPCANSSIATNSATTTEWASFLRISSGKPGTGTAWRVLTASCPCPCCRPGCSPVASTRAWSLRVCSPRPWACLCDARTCAKLVTPKPSRAWAGPSGIAMSRVPSWPRRT